MKSPLILIYSLAFICEIMAATISHQAGVAQDLSHIVETIGNIKAGNENVVYEAVQMSEKNVKKLAETETGVGYFGKQSISGWYKTLRSPSSQNVKPELIKKNHTK